MRDVLHIHDHAVLLILQLVLLHQKSDQLSIVLLNLVSEIVEDDLNHITIKMVGLYAINLLVMC